MMPAAAALLTTACVPVAGNMSSSVRNAPSSPTDRAAAEERWTGIIGAAAVGRGRSEGKGKSS